MRFAIYTLPDDPPCMRGIALEKLIELARDGSIFARAEDSGCEGCYIEVARWNKEADEWQRFAFEKVFGGEDMSLDQQDVATKEELCCHATAERIAERINVASGNKYMAFVHHFPTYGTKKESVKS